MTLYIQDLLRGTVPLTKNMPFNAIFEFLGQFALRYIRYLSGVQYSLKRKTSNVWKVSLLMQKYKSLWLFFKHVGSRYQRWFTTLQQHSRFSSKYFKDMILIHTLFLETPEITTPLTLSSEDGSVSQNPATICRWQRRVSLFSSLNTQYNNSLSLNAISLAENVLPAHEM